MFRRQAVLSAAAFIFFSSWLQAAPADFSDSLILLKGGTVQMGGPATERQRSPDELEHSVQINPFWIDPKEVTQADYEAIMGVNPSGFKGAKLPVERVTWLEAVQYCNALSAKRGLKPVYQIEGEAVSWDRSADGYRLLTEAEWEYAGAPAQRRSLIPAIRFSAIRSTFKAAIRILLRKITSSKEIRL